MSLFPAAVLFDLDGTLVDTAPDFVRVLNDLRLKYEPAIRAIHLFSTQSSWIIRHTRERARLYRYS